MASIRAKGSKFEVRVMLGGKSVSRTFPTQEEGQRWAAGVQYGFIAPTASKSTACAIPTLGEACDQYINEVATTHKGAKQERYRAEALKRHPLAKRLLNKITTEHLRFYRDKMLADGLSGSTVLLNLTLVSNIFRHAREECGLVIENPVSKIKKPKAGKARTRRLQAEEESRLMTALSGCRNPQVIRVVQFLLETGMRRSEVLTLTWGRIDLQKRLVTLEETKNGHPRWIPLTATACAVLISDPIKNGLAFPLSESALTQAWGHALKRAKITDLRLHDLRHEALSRWAHRLKGDVFKLALISGHRTLQMAQRYVHPAQSELLANQYITLQRE